MEDGQHYKLLPEEQLLWLKAIKSGEVGVNAPPFALGRKLTLEPPVEFIGIGVKRQSKKRPLTVVDDEDEEPASSSCPLTATTTSNYHQQR